MRANSSSPSTVALPHAIADEHAGHLDHVTSWALGPDGYLYASSYGSALASPYVHGALYRAILAGSPEP